MKALRRLTAALKGDTEPSMGQNHSRDGGRGSRPGAGHDSQEAGGASTGTGHQAPDRSRRASRADLSILLGASTSSSRRQEQADAPFERKETRAEREARRAEKERAARIKERERSMKEEHVDGGYLVTMGIYPAMEDYSKTVVRHLQLERRLAPFWRGLDDVKSSWADHQVIAAARGLPIPPADVVPDGLLPPPQNDDSNVNNLMVPMGPRTLSASSERSGSTPTSAIPSPTSPGPRLSSPLSKGKRSLAAALNISSRNSSQQDIAPREVSLPDDPYVNGQPLEVFLYRDAIECPVCFMAYPRFLNKTRCCNQDICSECFVQIKRPDPHYPEHHGDQPQNETSAPAPNSEEGADAEELIMEPACCPYCTVPDFGVTYEPPPFRRGLAYATNPPNVGALGAAMSSSSSLNSGLSPTSATTPGQAGRRRTQSVSANNPGVITTDRIRPDWSTKLSNALQQQRRRAAAADALHHAAFVIGNNDVSNRSLFTRSGRFSRRGTGPRGNDNPETSALATTATRQEPDDRAPDIEPGPRSSSGRTGPGSERVDAAHLESMMMAEAIRLSLADEEERKQKADKEARKEAKKKEKEDRKVNKRKSAIYGGGAASASASSLSLSLSSFGRKRANSHRTEASVAAPSTSASRIASQSHEVLPSTGLSALPTADKGKAIDRGDLPSSTGSSQQAADHGLPSPATQPTRGSHLRQISNVSSVSDISTMDNTARSPEPPALSESGATGLGVSSIDEEAGEGASEAGSPGPESMFNFRSLADMVGVPIDGEARAVDGLGSGGSGKGDEGDGHHEHVEHAPAGTTNEAGAATGVSAAGGEDGGPKIDTVGANSALPAVTVTPGTPALGSDEDSFTK